MSYADQEIKQKSKYLKIEAGAPMVIRLLDAAPVEIIVHTLDRKDVGPDGKFEIPCKGEECELCQDGQEPIQKFITNVYNHTLGKVQIFKYGTMIAKQIKKIAVNLCEEKQDIMRYDLKLEAEGSNLSKKYSVTLRTTPLELPLDLKKYKLTEDIPF